MIRAISQIPNYFNCCVSHKKEKISPFQKLKDLKELAKTLTSADCDFDQWKVWKGDIKKFISTYSDDWEDLDEFFTTITEWGIDKNPQKVMGIFAEILDLDILTDVISTKCEDAEIPFDNVFEWAAENASICPKPIETSVKANFLAEWKRYRPIVLYFIPNLVNIFLGAFNFLDSQKKYTTLWEKHLLLEIVYKFFIIPYCLITLLRPVFVIPAKVYMVAALIIVATGVLVSFYQRWLKPLPDEIVNCTNLDKKMEQGLIGPKVGQAKEIQRLIAALEVDRNVLLIGQSGEGKTALMHHFIQLKQQKKLSEELEKLTVYEVDCGLMLSNVNYGHSELINQIKDQIDGFEDKVVLFFDEFDQVLTNKGAFQVFKKRFLEDEPRTKFVATISTKEFKELRKHDIDSSFWRRVYPIVLDSSSDEQNELIIRDLIYRVAKDVPVTEDAIQEILKVSADEDYMPDIGRSAKAIKILMDALGLCRAAYNPHYVSIELIEAKQEYKNLMLKVINPVKASPAILKQKKKLQSRIKILEKDLLQNKKHIKKIREINAQQQKMNSEYYRLTHLLAQTVPDLIEDKASDDLKIDFDDLENDALPEIDEDLEEETPSNVRPLIPKDSISQKDQMMYLWYHFYAIDAFKKLLNLEIEKVSDEIPIQVNADLVRQVYEESKDIEDNFLDET